MKDHQATGGEILQHNLYNSPHTVISYQCSHTNP